MVGIIRLAVGGSKDFTDTIQRQVRGGDEIRLVNVTTEPSMTIDTLENQRINVDAVLLGYEDRDIQIVADVATRNGVSAIFFVSTCEPANAYFKWSKYKMKVVTRNKELESLVDFFKERPELLREGTVSRNTIFDEEDMEDSIARIEKARREEEKYSPGVVDKRVYVIYGPKGGIGKSVTAVSMAKSISTLTNLRVAIVDLELNRDYGDILRYFGFLEDRKAKMIELKTPEWAKGLALPQEKTMSGWSCFPWELRNNRQAVEESLVKIDHNLFLLPPFRSIMDGKAIDYKAVQKTIDAIKRHFSVIIVDGSNTLTTATLAAIEMCDELYILASAKIPVLDSLADFIASTINDIQGDPVISLIINDVPSEFPYNLADDVPKLAGGFPVAALFPKDEELDKMVSTKARVPYLGAHDIPYTREMEKLLRKMFPKGMFKDRNEGKRGFLGGLFAKISKATG